MPDTVIESFSYLPAEIDAAWDALTAVERLRRWHPFILAIGAGSSDAWTISLKLPWMRLSRARLQPFKDADEWLIRWRFRSFARLRVGRELCIRLAHAVDGGTWLCQHLLLGHFATRFSTLESRNARLAAMMEIASRLQEELATCPPAVGRGNTSATASRLSLPQAATSSR